MVEHIHTYFDAEKLESLWFIGLGVSAILCSLVFLFTKNKILNGMVIPLCSIGLIQIIVGSTVYFRVGAGFADPKRHHAWPGPGG